jgi:hypothetical protein
MPLPLLGLLGGGAVLGGIGNLISGGAKKKAAQAQAQGYAQAGQGLQDMYNQGQLATQPYRQGAEQAYGQMQQLQSPEGRAGFLADYSGSAEGQYNAQQAEDAYLRNASATGGMRTGQANVAVGSIQPQLANQAYNQQFQGLQQLAQPGMQMASQTAGLAPQVGQQMGQFSVGQGGAQGQANSAMGNAIGNTMGQFGGLLSYGGQGGFGGGFGGGGGGGGTQFITTAPDASGYGGYGAGLA